MGIENVALDESDIEDLANSLPLMGIENPLSRSNRRVLVCRLGPHMGISDTETCEPDRDSCA